MAVSCPIGAEKARLFAAGGANPPAQQGKSRHGKNHRKIRYEFNLRGRPRALCHHSDHRCPQDVGGDAASFSPTDLVGTALLTCILTTMGLVATRLGLDLSGTTGSVEKIMTDTKPRRIASLLTILDLPLAVDDTQREKLEHAAHHCPVHHSLHPEIKAEIVFNWLASQKAD